RFNRRLLNACLRAQTQTEPVRPGQLHVAIIGAGATGTELAAQLIRTIREVVGSGLDRIDPLRDVRVVLIEGTPRILPGLPERTSEAAHRLLDKMGVEVLTGARVKEVTAEGLELADGAFIASELIVWAAGVKAPEVLQRLDGLETNRINQLVVEPTLQTTRDPDIFAIGDCAACPRPGASAPVPPRAQAAHQEASHMFRQIERRLRGKPLEPYVYRDFGSLVSLGRWKHGRKPDGIPVRPRHLRRRPVCPDDVPVASPHARSGDRRHEARRNGADRPRSGASGRPAVKLH